MERQRRTGRFGLALAVILLLAACDRRPRPRSTRSFEQIAAQVDGLAGDQVVALLGEPDTRELVFDGDERWIWWRYTFLEGSAHPPELRGRAVHLEIFLSNPGGLQDRPPYSAWRVDADFGVAYRLPDLEP